MIPPLGRGSLLLRTLGIFDPLTWDGHCGLVVGTFNCGPIGRWFESALCQSTLTFPPVVHDWVNKGLGMSSCVCVTGPIKLKHPVPLSEKSRASCPSGRFPPSFIQGVKPPLKLKGHMRLSQGQSLRNLMQYQPLISTSS